MERRCVGLLFAVSLLTGAVAAQTPKEIADAIAQLPGPREDTRAMEFLIDAGKPADELLLRELSGVIEHPDDPKMPRILRVLRARGHHASAACHVLVQLLMDERLTAAEPSDGLVDELVDTLVALIPFGAGHLKGIWPEHVVFRLTDLGVADSRLVQLSGRWRAAARAVAGGAEASIDSEDPVDRALALERIGPQDRALLPRLLALADLPPGTSPPFRTVRDAASRAIARIDPDHPQAVRGLAMMVDSADDPRDRVRAAQALGRHGEAAKDHVDVLLAALDSDDDRLVAEAITTLGMIGVASDSLLERLRVLAEHPRRAMAARAKAALRALDERGG